MATTQLTRDLPEFLRDFVVSLVRRKGADLTARQMAVFLTCYLDDTPQTVRGLAADFRISRPAVSRALDRLGNFYLVRRKIDPQDRRSVLVQRTSAGREFLRELTDLAAEAAGSSASAKRPKYPSLSKPPKPKAPRGRASTGLRIQAPSQLTGETRATRSMTSRGSPK